MHLTVLLFKRERLWLISAKITSILSPYLVPEHLRREVRRGPHHALAEALLADDARETEITEFYLRFFFPVRRVGWGGMEREEGK